MFQKRFEYFKCHQAGNDFLIAVRLAEEEPNPEEVKLVPRLCHRRKGMGADGVIFVFRSDIKGYDFEMRLFNSDGSEAEISGNGLCCLAKTLYDADYTAKQAIVVDTKAGVQRIELTLDESGNVGSATVRMPKPNFVAASLPVSEEFADPRSEPQELALKVGRTAISGVPVSVGNPHFVVFTDSPAKWLERFGARLERHKAFPNRVNVQFVRVEVVNRLQVYTYERGAGPTLACGSGATAAAAAAARKGLISPDEPVEVIMPGGTLKVLLNTDTGEPLLTGSPVLVGKVEWFE